MHIHFYINQNKIKTTMKKIILSLLVAGFLVACSNNLGKKVSIEGTKGTVYYKGEGVTEADAQKLGAYLKDNVGYFNNSAEKSVRLVKGEDGTYEIRFASSEEQLKAAPDVSEGFKKLGAAMSIELYNNTPVTVVLTDAKDKALQTLAFDKEIAKQLQEALDKAKQDAAAEEMTTSPATDDDSTDQADQ